MRQDTGAAFGALFGAESYRCLFEISSHYSPYAINNNVQYDYIYTRIDYFVNSFSTEVVK